MGIRVDLYAVIKLQFISLLHVSASRHTRGTLDQDLKLTAI